MSVYSALGQEVIASTTAIELDVSYLSPGVYYVVLENSGVLSTQKFVKM